MEYKKIRLTDGTSVVRRVDAAAKRAGLTRKELAGMLNVGVQVFTNWSIRGSFPSATALFQIADALEVSAEWLMFGEERGLSGEDAKFLDLFRQLNDNDRATVTALLEVLNAK